MAQGYYVTRENGCITEHDSNGKTSVHKEEMIGIRRASDLATTHGGPVFVRDRQAGSCRPSCARAHPRARVRKSRLASIGWSERSILRAFSE